MDLDEIAIRIGLKQTQELHYVEVINDSFIFL